MTRRPEPDRGEVAADVADVVEQMAARLRGFGSRQWREAVPPDGRPLGDVVHDLVVWCAQREAALCPPASGSDVVPVRPRYDAALADQLAVVGHDLADALSAAGGGATAKDVLETLTAYAERLRLTLS